MDDVRARRILGLPQGVHLAGGRIKRAWKAAAISTHPDRGGTPEAFVRASQAAQFLKQCGGMPGERTPREPNPSRPQMQVLGPVRPRPRTRSPMDPGYWSKQRDMESMYGNLGSYGRDGLTRTWYWWHGG